MAHRSEYIECSASRTLTSHHPGPRTKLLAARILTREVFTPNPTPACIYSSASTSSPRPQHHDYLQAKPHYAVVESRKRITPGPQRLIHLRPAIGSAATKVNLSAKDLVELASDAGKLIAGDILIK